MIRTKFGSRYRFAFYILIGASVLLSGCGGGSSGTDQTAQDVPAVPAPTSNSAPTIAGAATTVATVGKSYSFQPSASDGDHDVVTFTIANKPKWASFEAATGTLSGTPAEADVGTYADIELAATDGKTVTSMPKFAITVSGSGAKSVSLEWEPPTDNSDGTPLQDLSGYKIYYGNTSKKYSASIVVNNPGVTRYVVDTLPTGQYYFALTALNASGLESSMSDEVSATFN
jgi:hypothetical protein